MQFEVFPEEHGLSLVSVIYKRMEGKLSIKVIKRWIADKGCLVNNRMETFASRKVMEKDLIVLKEFRQEKSNTVEIVFEDDDFIIVNKPSGVVSSLHDCHKFLSRKRLYVVHRLDKETTGLWMLAKTERGEKEAKKLFAARAIQKIYVAIVDGVLPQDEGVEDSFLGEHTKYQGQTVYGVVRPPLGKRAITKWRVWKRGKDSTCIFCDLQTGRTHQIRVHMSALRHPILGDHQYAKGKWQCFYEARRVLLHARELRFVHPFTKKTIVIQAAFPTDFMQALDALYGERL